MCEVIVSDLYVRAQLAGSESRSRYLRLTHSSAWRVPYIQYMCVVCRHPSCLESALYSVSICGVQAPLLPGECLIFSICVWCAGTPPAWRVRYIQYLCVVCRHPSCLESALYSVSVGTPPAWRVRGAC